MSGTTEDELVALADRAVPVRWRHNARARRVTLRIDPRGGAVVVTLPPRTSRAAGLRLLRTHAGWVAERLGALPRPVTLESGASVMLDGVAHPIRHRPEARGGAWVEAGEIHVAGDAAFLPRRVADLLRAEARRRLGAQAAAKAARAGVLPARITCKDTRSRWGSCSADRVLMFSWRLVMAPPHVQDYVVAHEVAHLLHMDHSPRFWAAVRSLTPHTEAATRWLRAEGPALLRVG